jgi:hypothetical protein
VKQKIPDEYLVIDEKPTINTDTLKKQSELMIYVISLHEYIDDLKEKLKKIKNWGAERNE